MDQGYAGVLLRFGRYERTLSPGLYAINRGAQTVRLVSLKTVALQMPLQSSMTRDNVAVSVDAVAYFAVVDPARAVFAAASSAAATARRSRVDALSASPRASAAEGRGRVHTKRRMSRWSRKASEVELKGVEVCRD